MQSAPERALGNSQLTRELGVESPASLVFDDRVSERWGAAVIDTERVNRVIRSGDGRESSIEPRERGI